MQVALAQRVRLVVRQRRTVVLNVMVPARYLRSLLHKVLLELQRRPTTAWTTVHHLMRAVVHGAGRLGRPVPRMLDTHLVRV